MAGKPSFFRRLVGGLWRTLALIYSLIFLLILLAIPVSIYLVLHHPAPPVPNKAVLVIDPVGNLVEQEDGVGSLVQSALSNQGQPSVVRNLITALDRARTDDRIKEVLLKLDDLDGAAPGQLQDLVAAIDRFKQSGKPVIAWADAYDESRYELASHADKIVVDPLGYVLLTGYGAYRNYYKDALDKLGVTVNVFRVGKYKSYVEPYTRNDMSPAARADNLAWMNSLWGIYKKTVTADRDITPSDIDQYINNYASNLVAHGGNAAALAKQAGLVDQVASLDELHKPLIAKVGRDPASGSFNQVSQSAYLADTNAHTAVSDSKLAVVTVAGDIVNGESVPGSAGGETVARLIDAARRDDHVAGLVLRVNSPGGSVTAAERIRRAVLAFREAGKPVVVSMAGMAASGGYWVSMNANQIWAEPSTITGSIGIFAIVPTFSKPLNKLGIHTDGVGTTKLSGAMRLDKPLSEPIKTILQAGVEHGYNEFIGHVAKARNMSTDAVNKIAQGRVWSGADAERIGLVDKLGDVTQAEAAAAKLAGLQPDHYQLRVMRPPSDWQAVMQQFFSSHISAALLPAWLSAPVHTDAVDFLRSLTDPHGLYARCFCRLQSADTLSGAAEARQALKAP
ncbi:signal peptide peptidase SppA [Salinisphaera hydrothermalis]|uniref:Signal peptide peptidase SppA, 67K type n=1 Tax=Salinisphaera hydrothermalis (strain C41B8) TaxID=1304275 RepID=A0A084IH13_SALHC|nr:signal peptide peptidase SppA [Salinisphaera hydrothermalis]KEZ75997.1 signal peptide peptidase SppA, 67K type [Salinisphaera hydrothermalis C41B8]